MRSSPVRVLTNVRWWAGRSIDGRPIDSIVIDERGLFHQLLQVAAVWRYDYVVLNIEARLLFLVCVVKKLLPFARIRVISVDLILVRPRSARGRAAFMLRRWLLREVDRIILYYRDTSDIRSLYDIPEERVGYVPFKINTIDDVVARDVRDDGFVLACGRSNRDYQTLCSAMRDLPFECRILAPWSEMAAHGTGEGLTDRPANVLLECDDGTPESWNATIARCRCVVLPINPGMLSPSGIGTYLVAMALGKPVIITDSTATRGMLTSTEAVLVPPSDPAALRDAIQRVMTDDDYRSNVAQAGRAYALALGGEERLQDDLLKELAEVVRSMGLHRTEQPGRELLRP